MDSTFYPLVSIVIPVYNGANYLRDAIDSALSQTYNNIEIIVVNDGSTDCDSTETIAKSYGDKIRYYAKDNGGVASAVNMGIQNMRGDYFAWLAHDDWWLETKVETMLAHAEKHGVLSQVIVSNYDNYLQSKQKRLNDSPSLDFSSIYNIFQCMFTPEINIATFLIHRSVFENIGMFDETCVTTQDYDFIFRMVRFGCNFDYVNSITTIRRIHEQQGTATAVSLHLDELEQLYLTYIEVFFNVIKDFDLVQQKVIHDAMISRGLKESARRLECFLAKKRFVVESSRLPLWMYWENKQGVVPPAMIRQCWDSINQHCGSNFQIINLDNVTIRLFLEHFNEKVWRFEQIAHRADYFRFMLLEQYGGVWLDSDNMLFDSLSDVIEKLKQYHFITTGYKAGLGIFPLISFLAATKSSPICQAIIENFEAYFKTHEKEFKQPGWDELGGIKLSELLQVSTDFYIYPIEFFYPVPTWKMPQELFMSHTEESCKAIKAAFAQALSYSVVKDVYLFFCVETLVDKLNLGLILKRAKGDVNFYCSSFASKPLFFSFKQRLNFSIHRAMSYYRVHGFFQTASKIAKKIITKVI